MKKYRIGPFTQPTLIAFSDEGVNTPKDLYAEAGSFHEVEMGERNLRVVTRFLGANIVEEIPSKKGKPKKKDK